jgi:phosphopantetheinyl transferase
VAYLQKLKVPERLTLPAQASPVELWLFQGYASRAAQAQAMRQWLRAQTRFNALLVETATGPQFVEKSPPDSTPTPWHISLTYCEDMALCALSDQGQPGVDMTALRSFPELLEVAALYFSPTVAANMTRYNGSEQVQQFAEHWSALEAQLKAIGQGLREWSAQRDVALASTRILWQGLFQGFTISLAIK